MLLVGPCAALLHPEFIELLAFGSDSAKPARSCPTQQWSRTSLQRQQVTYTVSTACHQDDHDNDEARDSVSALSSVYSISNRYAMTSF